VGEERWMLQIDVDPREIGKNYPVDVALVGNAKPVLKELDFEIRREASWLKPKEQFESRVAIHPKN
jgi:acetolactate synthase-1/2/3 large subunit